MDISGLFLHVDSAYTFYGVFSKLLVSSVIARELDKQKAIFLSKITIHQPQSLLLFIYYENRTRSAQ